MRISGTKLIVTTALLISQISYSKSTPEKEKADEAKAANEQALPTLSEKEATSLLETKIEHMSADIIQTNFKSLRKTTTTKEGRGFFSKPGIFKLSYQGEKTGLEEYYFDGKMLSHFLEKENLVKKYGTQSGQTRDLREVVLLVLDPKYLIKQYNISNAENQPEKGLGIREVVLTSKTEGQTDISTINLKIGTQEKYVQEVRINYTDGNYTQLAFKNPSFKPNPSKIFKFTAPSGVKEQQFH